MPAKGRGGTTKTKKPVNPFSTGRSVLDIERKRYGIQKASPTKRIYTKKSPRNVNEDIVKTPTHGAYASGIQKGKSNPNYTRASMRVIECNGIKANNLVDGVTVDHNAKVTVYTSIMVLNPSTGAMESNMLNCLLANIYKFAKGGTVVAKVAWMSHERICEAFAECKQTLFIVNNEAYDTWGGGKCMRLFDMFPPCDPISDTFGHLDTPLQCVELNKRKGKKSDYKPVRTWGNRNSIEHNKCVIFFEKRYITAGLVLTEPNNNDSVSEEFKCLSPEGFLTQLAKRKGIKMENLQSSDGDYFDIPCAYWDGSFNFTRLATTHDEGAQLVESDILAWAKFKDFASTWVQTKPVNGGRNCLTPEEHVKRLNDRTKGKFISKKQQEITVDLTTF